MRGCPTSSATTWTKSRIVPNVPTWRCLYEDELRFVLDNMRELVVKPANESGGYGIVDRRPRAPTKSCGRAQTRSVPTRGTGSPSRSWRCRSCRRCATAGSWPRHVDLRPFILSGASRYVTAGGLTRVALREGSLIVNSSQGGGSKDTWVVDMEAPEP